MHQLLFPHLLPGFDSFTRGPYEGDGERNTVNPSGVSIRSGVGYARSGASERFIVDFSDLQNSWSVIPSGQRAISNSKHYSDQLEELFLQGKYHRNYFYEKEDFPESHIESQISFVDKQDPEFLIILTTSLIISFSAGIVIAIFGYYKRDLIRSKFKDFKEKMRGDKN